MKPKNDLKLVWHVLAVVCVILLIILVIVIRLVTKKSDEQSQTDSSSSSLITDESSTSSDVIQDKFISEAEAYQLCVQNGEKYGVDPVLILSIIKVESSFQINADSGIAKGLMQITPETYYGEIQKRVTELYDKDEIVLFDPYYNILCGTYYLYRLQKSLNTMNEVIVAYNWGISNVLNLLKDDTGVYTEDGKTLVYDNIPSEGAKAYLKKVTEAYKYYKSIYD